MTSKQVSNAVNKLTLLVLTLELRLRESLSECLENAGYICFCPENPAQAKNILMNNKVALMLCDLDILNQSAFNLIDHMQEYSSTTGIILIISANASGKHWITDDNRIYGCIVKPFSADALLAAVQMSLQHRSMHNDLQTYKNATANEVWEQAEKMHAIINNLNVGVIMFTPELQMAEKNLQIRRWFPGVKDSKEQFCFQLLPCTVRESPCENCQVLAALDQRKAVEAIRQLQTKEGIRHFRIVASPIFNREQQITAVVGLYVDITNRVILEQELRQAQKIEAIGQLAAGIAHEINTPVQYVHHNLSFLKESYHDLFKVITVSKDLFAAIKEGKLPEEEAVRTFSEAIEDADLDYLFEEIPKTVDQGIDGMLRVEKILRAMKEFSHPGSDEKSKTDVNGLLDSTLTVSRNQWKYVAEVETDFEVDLPLVPCLAGEMNQVFLNLIINAAHAIEDKKKNTGTELGKITVSTRATENAIQIRIGDTGGGIPDSIGDRIFDAFFTTKAMGKGTGQGLAIAKRVVIDKHQGSLTFETEVGKGTTFIINLPLTSTTK